MQDDEVTGFDVVPGEMEGDVDVFGAVVDAWIVGDVDGGLVVAKGGRNGRSLDEFQESALQPELLFSTHRKGHILSFSGGVSSSGLFASAPADGARAELEDIARE